MITLEIINQLLIPSKESEQKIENLLKDAYIGIQDLRRMSLNRNLTLEYIEKVERLFEENQFNSEELYLPRYLQKYAQCLSSFWDSYSYYNGWQQSKGEFHLFKSLKEYDLVLNVHHSESDCANILRKMEDYWIASNQVYTKYQIDLINKKYIR
ncbi:hypothetical protein [Flavobacterium sp. FlaQc-47]|uniref:hypothetical protein n=1 Tax=Flavobacterium sp. FlaQc-47 TaxID=3374180 RepID=UPI003757AA15